MPEGIITKAISGFYYVQEGDVVRQCRARGVFKKNGITPLVGDRVLYEPMGSEGIVNEVLPRKNELVRPPVANLDQSVLTFSAKEPEFNAKLLDRMLVHVERESLPAVIILTKVDLLDDPSVAENWLQPYRDMGYETVPVATKQGAGLERVRELLQDKLSGLAGNSGVGKSTLLNALVPGLNLNTAEISQKLGRGKHTTRHSEIFRVFDDTFVIDTPGFSTLEFTGMEPEDLSQYFRDIWDVGMDCKYRGCLHESEDGCAVRPGSETGRVSATRYRHYLEFLAELKEAKEYRY
ncbi:ribosome small subunit-dependent GTPase A [Tumebacillus sp. ITR2]|uniref:Small ribosomal subunit biogenesis GTPase RsgA n=1 Tax=Tumebacillus amylolyticus TaxID=2801339 RepID=A0ABS1JEX4_9BACL|nr:ribosome small subunit-dependent GTPase A [Tumebacillus amylolyticus]MBL0388831.1 ribosome small subunit-dependent GTPase A [Tumebacillus amylolyticus]